jgi:NitT/TauT family transport system permease protein
MSDRKSIRGRSLDVARGFALPLLLLAAAEAAMHSYPDDGALAAPSAIGRSLIEGLSDLSLVQALGHTLLAAAGGLALGGGLGLLTGLWFGLSRRAARASALAVELLRPVPSIALVPLALLEFGFGYRMEIAVVAFTCLWPMLLFTQAAVRQIEPRLIEVGRMLRLSPRQQVRLLMLPAATPRLFTALRLDIGVALVVAVTVEVAANPQGLGYEMIAAQQSLDSARMYAALIVIATTGWVISESLVCIERRLFGRRSAPIEGGAR